MGIGKPKMLPGECFDGHPGNYLNLGQVVLHDCENVFFMGQRSHKPVIFFTNTSEERNSLI